MGTATERVRAYETLREKRQLTPFALETLEKDRFFHGASSVSFIHLCLFSPMKLLTLLKVVEHIVAPTNIILFIPYSVFENQFCHS